jgi:hemolysin-activating ACP:hemolysin acyltransferase
MISSKIFQDWPFWAKVSKNTSERLLHNGLDSLKSNEINNGNETWMMELSATNGSLHQIIRILRDKYLRDSPQVTYFKTKNGKRISRTDYTSFFHSPTPAKEDDNNFIQSYRGTGLRHSAEMAELTAQTLGEVALLAFHISEIGNLPFSSAVARLMRPCNLHQHRLYRDANGQLFGYVSWAWLDSDLARKGIPTPQALAPHQWNEGSTLVIYDAFATPLGLADVCTDLTAGLFPDETMHLRITGELHEIVKFLQSISNHVIHPPVPSRSHSSPPRRLAGWYSRRTQTQVQRSGRCGFAAGQLLGHVCSLGPSSPQVAHSGCAHA